jgi:predicted transcriptional regulator
MTTLTAHIPDSLARQVEELASREHVQIDQLVAIALASQVAGWETRNSVEQRAQRGSVGQLREALDRVCERPPLEGDAP